jgi:P pilus assembly chaperone PapD
MDHDPPHRSPEQIRAYIDEDAARREATWREKYDHIVRAKNAIWLLLLIVVFLQVHLLNVMIEATSLDMRAAQGAASVRLINCPPPAVRL